MVNPSCSEINGLPQDTEVSFVPMESVCEYGGLRLDKTKHLVDVYTGYTYFRDGDAVIAKITPCFENGKGSIAQKLVNGVGFGTTELHVLRPTSRLDVAFLFYLTISHPFRSIGTSYMYGAGGQKRVPGDFVRDFRHPIPPLDEQRAIAAFLDRETARIDALIEKKRRQIELLNEKRVALISHAVTKGLDPDAPMKDSSVEWIGRIPAHWAVMRFAWVSRVVRGASPRPAGDPRFFHGDHVPWITVAEITKDSSKYLESTETMLTEEGRARSRLLKGSTLVLTNSGATLGVPKILFIDGCANDGVVAFEALDPSYSKDYLYYYLLSLTGMYRDRTRQGSGQPNLNTDIVRATEVPCPPTEEQEAIAVYVESESDRMEALVSKIQQSTAFLREYRTALISAAVTGKIDVRGSVIEPKETPV